MQPIQFEIIINTNALCPSLFTLDLATELLFPLAALCIFLFVPKNECCLCRMLVFEFIFPLLLILVPCMSCPFWPPYARRCSCIPFYLVAQPETRTSNPFSIYALPEHLIDADSYAVILIASLYGVQAIFSAPVLVYVSFGETLDIVAALYGLRSFVLFVF